MSSKLVLQFAILVALSTQTLQAATYNTIALSGLQGTNMGLGPGLGADVHFDIFDDPVLNSNGKVAFLSTLTGSGTDATNNLGVWSTASGTLNVVARTGSSGPGPGVGSGVDFTLLDDPVLNNYGKIAFVALLTGTDVTTANNRGIWTNANGPLSIVARSGNEGPGPGIGTGVDFSGFSPLLFNDADQIAFGGQLTGTGVDGSNSSGFWIRDDGSLNVAVRLGVDGPGPGMGPGINYATLLNPRMNGSGRIVFYGTVAGTGINNSNSQGVWTYHEGQLQLIARSGSTGPGPNLGTGVYFSFLGPARINATGDVAFLGDLTGTGITSSNNRAVWKSTEGEIQLIARRGADGPGPGVGAGVSFSLMNGILLNAAGDVMFRGTLTGSGIDSTNNSGLWLHKDGTLAIVARTGDSGPGPGLGAGVSFSGFPSHTINTSGVIAFAGALAGTGIDSTNNAGIWASVDGSIVNIVRTGNPFDVDPTTGVDLRTISDVGLTSGTSGEDGRGIVFNEQGLLAFRLGFTDGSSGVFTAQIGGETFPGDFDGDGDVDGRDFLAWQRNPAIGNLVDWQENYPGALPGDLDADGDVDGRDFLVWQRNPSVGSLADWHAGYGAGTLGVIAAVPEPSVPAIALLGLIVSAFRAGNSTRLARRSRVLL